MSTPRNSNLARRGTSVSVSHRPHSIAELADLAKLTNWDGSIGLKHWLRTAEKARKNGEDLADKREYEHAFIELAKAATIVLEKIPTHNQYHDVLNSEQRSNLSKVCTSRLALPHPWWHSLTYFSPRIPCDFTSSVSIPYRMVRISSMSSVASNLFSCNNTTTGRLIIQVQVAPHLPNLPHVLIPARKPPEDAVKISYVPRKKRGHVMHKMHLAENRNGGEMNLRAAKQKKASVEPAMMAHGPVNQMA